jgi:hypothetical protein
MRNTRVLWSFQVPIKRAVMTWHATSAKMTIMLLRLKKDGKYVSAIVKVAIGELPSVRMANS